MPEVDDEHQAVVKELKVLRQRQGLTLDKLSRAPHLQAALASWIGRQSISLSEANDLLRRAVAELGDGNHAMAVRNALAIDATGNPQTLSNRRENFLNRASRAHPDTIENWENAGFNELSTHLLSREGATASTQQGKKPQEEITKEENDVLYRYSGRTVQEVIVTKTVRATEDGVRSVPTRHRYFADPRPGVIKIEALGGCYIDEPIQYRSDGMASVNLKLPKTLNKGEQHRYSYRLRVTSDEPAAEVLLVTVHAPNIAYTIRCQFDPNTLPVDAWSFDGLTEAEWPGRRTPENSIEIPQHGFVEISFSDMHVGLRYGFAWKWPD